MNNNFTEIKKASDKNFGDVILEAPFPQEDSAVFQIFFIEQDYSKGVEILETNMIDFDEIVHRLMSGESVFIKNKNTEILESHSEETNEENSSWYFNRC